MSHLVGRCPLCKTSDTLEIVRQEKNSLMQCSDCRLVYRHPMPTLEHYEELGNDLEYPWYKEFDLAQFEFIRFKKTNQYFQIQRRLKYVQRHKSSGNLLDVGCGLGFFVWEAAKCGFSATGMDTSQKAVKWAQETLHVDARAGKLEEMNLHAGQFDIVTLWHVLEHLTDPVETLRYLHRLIKSNGYIFVEVPNVAALEIKVKNFLSKYHLKRNPWGHFGMPEHLYEFSPATFRRLVALAGLQIVYWTTLPRSSNPLLNLLYDRTKIGNKMLFVLAK